MPFTHHNHKCSAVNHAPIANAQPKRIQNRVHRQCAKDGFDTRIREELAAACGIGQVPPDIPLHSHHATRQHYFNLGWNAVTPAHVLRAKARINFNDKG
jgi:hypothetical protein